MVGGKLGSRILRKVLKRKLSVSMANESALKGTEEASKD
jgi:hypothetical protein